MEDGGCWFYDPGISAVSWFYNGECSYVGSVMLDEVVLDAGVGSLLVLC